MTFCLKTKRLILRAFADADVETFAAYRSDAEVARYQSWDTPYTSAQARAFVTEMQHIQPGTIGEWYQIAIELRASGQLIGDCAFCVLADDPQQAEIGYTLARPYQGHGYATEAAARLLEYLFAELDLHRVRAICDVENVSSAHVIERIGMRREGHFVDNVWSKGRWSSEYCYAILQSEWAQNRRHAGLLASDAESNDIDNLSP